MSTAVTTASWTFPRPYGHYQLLERLGQGGMAEVFKARRAGPQGFEKIVVIKRILPHLASQERFVRMFVNEAKLAAQIQHQNVVQVFDLGQLEDGELFIAMEYVGGVDLRRLMALATENGLFLPTWFSLYVMREILSALQHAHELRDERGQTQSVIHRDVTPANVFLSNLGEVKLADFGIAKAIGESSDTEAGQVKGNVAYMAPEALYGEPLDVRADVFSAGTLLWELLTQQRLFLGRSNFETARAICDGERPPPSRYNAEIDDELDAVVLRALEIDREQRVASAHDLLVAVVDALSRLKARLVPTEVRGVIDAVLGRIPPPPELTGRRPDSAIHDKPAQRGVGGAFQGRAGAAPGSGSASAGSGGFGLTTPAPGADPSGFLGATPTPAAGALAANLRAPAPSGAFPIPAASSGARLQGASAALVGVPIAPGVPVAGVAGAVAGIAPPPRPPGPASPLPPLPGAPGAAPPASSAPPALNLPMPTFAGTPVPVLGQAMAAMVAGAPPASGAMGPGRAVVAPMTSGLAGGPSASGVPPGGLTVGGLGAPTGGLPGAASKLPWGPPRGGEVGTDDLAVARGAALAPRAGVVPGTSIAPEPRDELPEISRDLLADWSAPAESPRLAAAAPAGFVAEGTGLWLREGARQVTGPYDYDEILRMRSILARDVSCDGQRWLPLSQFVQLSGLDRLAPATANLRRVTVVGKLEQRSLVAVFAQLARERATGRLVIVESGARDAARREIDVLAGAPTFVFSDHPTMQLPELLVRHKIVKRDQLDGLLAEAMSRGKPLLDLMSWSAFTDINRYWPLMMRERLAEVFRWSAGRFAFDADAEPPRGTPFARTLHQVVFDAVHRSLSLADLTAMLGPRMQERLSKTDGFPALLRALGLGERQVALADKLGTRKTLAELVAKAGPDAHPLLVLAYLMLELGGLERA